MDDHREMDRDDAERTADRRVLETWAGGLVDRFRVPEPTAGGRRQFLKVGGLGLAGAALLAACSKHESPVAQSGTTALPDPTSTARKAPLRKPTDEDIAADKIQLRTATSLELLAVQVYDQVELKLPTSAGPIAQRFRAQHETHITQLQDLTQQAFDRSAVVDQPNAYLMDKLVTPSLQQLDSDAKTAGTDRAAQHASDNAFLSFLLSMEDTAASTYLSAVGILSGIAERHTVAGIAALSARRSAVLADLVNVDVPDGAFYSLLNAVPTDAYLT